MDRIFPAQHGSTPHCQRPGLLQTRLVSLPNHVRDDVLLISSLMSQFTIAADGKDSLRLASVELFPPYKGYSVDSGRSRSAEVLVRSTV